MPTLQEHFNTLRKAIEKAVDTPGLSDALHRRIFSLRELHELYEGPPPRIAAETARVHHHALELMHCRFQPAHGTNHPSCIEVFDSFGANAPTSDDTFIADLEKVADPIEALKKIVENESFFGFDPYYRDLRAALLKMATRISESPAKVRWVLCINDHPDSVYETEEEALAWRTKLNAPDAGLYFHVKQVTVGEPSSWSYDMRRNKNLPPTNA